VECCQFVATELNCHAYTGVNGGTLTDRGAVAGTSAAMCGNFESQDKAKKSSRALQKSQSAQLQLQAKTLMEEMDISWDEAVKALVSYGTFERALDHLREERRSAEEEIGGGEEEPPTEEEILRRRAEEEKAELKAKSQALKRALDAERLEAVRNNKPFFPYMTQSRLLAEFPHKYAHPMAGEEGVVLRFGGHS
jgi:hypothetical protein